MRTPPAKLRMIVVGLRGAVVLICGWLALPPAGAAQPDAGAGVAPGVLSPVPPATVQPIVNAPGQEFELTGGRRPMRAFVERGRVNSRKLILARREDRLRGWAQGAKIDMRLVSPTEVTGRVGDNPIRLSLQRGPERVEITGMYGGYPVDLVLDRRLLEGVVAGCEWTMRADGDSYLGNMVCAGTPYTGRLRIPASLASAPAPEFMSMLVALLSL